MVRTHVRKSNRGSYGSDQLKKALEAISAGKSVKSTAKNFGIPKTTLLRHRDAKVQTPGLVKLGRYETSLNKDFEKVLVEYLLYMNENMCGLSPKEVKCLAFQLAKRMGIKKPFNVERESAGYDWFQGFLKRWPILSVRKPLGTSIARKEGFTKENVEIFFTNLECTMQNPDFDPSRLWNADETGISTVVDPGKVLANKGC
jgi:hypothetical protein